jgi:hypothetical protein
MALAAAQAAHAICPVCTVAVGAGIGLSRWLGIDDTITGLWVGGLMVLLITWTLEWFEKKNIRFKGREIITALGYYVLVIAPLYYMDILAHPLNTLWGVDKLALGIGIGSLVFFGGARWYEAMKKANGGHAYFSFQKVVMPVAPLLILSAAFYFITR